MRSNFIKLEYELITLDNLNLAISIQGVVFPGESATEHYKVSIRTNYKNSSYYIIKMNGIPVGITGIYILNLYDENVIDKDDVWLGWYGILPEFRSRGIEKQSLLDTIEIAKRFNRKYFRLYTNNDINSTAYPLYEKVMSLREVYRNFEEDKEYVDKYAIYSCSFNDEEILLWNNWCAYISEDCKMCDVSNEKLKDSYKILFDCDLESKCFLDYERVASLFRNDGHLVYFINDKNTKYDEIISSLDLKSVMKCDLVEFNNFKENVYNKIEQVRS